MIPLGVLSSSRVAAAPVDGPVYIGEYTTTTAGGGASGSIPVSLGTPSADRVVIVALGLTNIRDPLTVTIGGVAATFDAQVVNTGAARVVIARAVVPEGAPETVSATWSYYGAAMPMWCAVYQSGPVSKVASAAVGYYTASCTETVAAVTGGFAIAAISKSSTQTTTWTGATETADPARYSSALATDTADTITVTAVTSTAGNPNAFLLATYDPA